MKPRYLRARRSGPVQDARDGDWLEFTPPTRLVCCDCSLAHDVRWKFLDGTLWMQFRRDQPMTTRYRRRYGQRVVTRRPKR